MSENANIFAIFRTKVPKTDRSEVRISERKAKEKRIFIFFSGRELATFSHYSAKIIISPEIKKSPQTLAEIKHLITIFE